MSIRQILDEMLQSIRTIKCLNSGIKSTLRTIQGFEDDLDTIQFQVTLMGLPALPSPPTTPQVQFYKTKLESLAGQMQHITIYVDELRTRMENLTESSAPGQSWLLLPAMLRKDLQRNHTNLEERMVALRRGVEGTLMLLQEAVRYYDLEGC